MKNPGWRPGSVGAVMNEARCAIDQLAPKNLFTVEHEELPGGILVLLVLFHPPDRPSSEVLMSVSVRVGLVISAGVRLVVFAVPFSAHNAMLAVLLLSPDQATVERFAEEACELRPNVAGWVVPIPFRFEAHALACFRLGGIYALAAFLDSLQPCPSETTGSPKT